MPVFVLTKYRELLEHFHETDWPKYHFASTTLNYFGFAEVQLEHVKETAAQLYDSKDSNITTRFYSYCLAMLLFLRSAMESSRALTDALKEREKSGVLQSYRDSNEKEITRKLDFISDKVVHPTEAKSKKSVHYEAGGMDSSANLTFYEHSADNPEHFKIIDVDIKKVFDLLHNYLEGLAPLLIPLLDK